MSHAQSLVPVVYLAAEKEFLGTIVISDTVKPEAKRAIAQLKQSGVKRQLCLPVTEKMSVKQ